MDLLDCGSSVPSAAVPLSIPTTSAPAHSVHSHQLRGRSAELDGRRIHAVSPMYQVLELTSCIPHPLLSFPLPSSLPTLFSKSKCGIPKTALNVCLSLSIDNFKGGETKILDNLIQEVKQQQIVSSGYAGNGHVNGINGGGSKHESFINHKGRIGNAYGL